MDCEQTDPSLCKEEGWDDKVEGREILAASLSSGGGGRGEGLSPQAEIKLNSELNFHGFRDELFWT